MTDLVVVHNTRSRDRVASGVASGSGEMAAGQAKSSGRGDKPGLAHTQTVLPDRRLDGRVPGVFGAYRPMAGSAVSGTSSRGTEPVTRATPPNGERPRAQAAATGRQSVITRSFVLNTGFTTDLRYCLARSILLYSLALTLPFLLPSSPPPRRRR